MSGRILMHDQTHSERRKTILARYPEVRTLFGRDLSSLFWAAWLSGAQLAIGWAVLDQDWWWVVLAALLVGSFIGHALNVLIHEATHDLILRGSAANKLAAIVANIATVFPAAIAFRHYHRLHHRYLGEHGADADLPMELELRLFDGTRVGKFVWLLLLPLWYGLVHPLQARSRIPLDRWLALNWLVTGGIFLAAWYGGGDMMALYLFLSAWFAAGMHPAGAHILQEHIWFSEPRETSSYYGPINRVSFNFGHHVEHHDFTTIPGRNLPRLRAMAPEFFPDDPAYRSRVRLLWRFVMDPKVRIGGRYVR